MSNYKGNFLTEHALRESFPVGIAGWYATVLEKNFVWNDFSQIWESRSGDSDTLGGELPSYYLDEANHTRTVSLATGNASLASGQRILEVDCTAGDVDVTLPDASGFVGKFDVVKVDSTANVVNVLPQAPDTVSGETGQEIYGQYDCMTLISDGNNWIIV